jgi:hypothetical protein
LDQTGQFFKEATVPANVQALAEKSVVATRDLYAKTATAVHDSAKALTNMPVPLHPATLMRRV